MVGLGVLIRNSGDDSQSYDYRGSARTWDIVTQTVCLTVSTVCIGMRMYTKLLVLKTAAWEDFTCFLAWLGLIGYAVITIEADTHGNGVHQDAIAPSDLREYAKLANASQLVYAPLIFMTKLSIFLLYLRVFTPSRTGKTYRVIHTFIWVNLVFYVGNFFLKVFQCIPRSKIWDIDTPGHCVNINFPIITTAAINVVSDFMMLSLPIACVWRLKMSSKRKIGVSAIFAAGIFGWFASIMRLQVSIRGIYTKDRTYDWYPEFLWTTAEVTCGIVASCLPALPSFFQHFFTKARKILTHSNHTEVLSGQERYLEKPTELYSVPRGRKPQLGHGSFITERSCDRGPELEDGRSDIFTGPRYTTSEAKIERNRTRVEGVFRGEVSRDREDGECHHSRGILKTIEVDVESGPRHFHNG